MRFVQHKSRSCSRLGRIRSTGFTLVELLVVVSIIALLLSVLLPSFKGAREQAKRIQCLSNMRSIDTTLLTYIVDYDALPVAYSFNASGCVCGWCTWSYGGWLGKNPHWKTSASGCFQIPSFKRPLSVYMTKGKLDAPVVDAANPAGMYELSELPVFKCPSDKVSAQWQWVAYGNGNASETYSAYNDVGTSYQMNFYWWHQTDKAEGADLDGDGEVEPTMGTCDTEPIPSCPSQMTDWPCRFKQGRQIWRKYQNHGTSRFVTLAEDPFDFAVVNSTQELGFHRKFSRHNMAFLDGHAESVDADTRQPRGVKWTVIDEEIEAVWW